MRVGVVVIKCKITLIYSDMSDKEEFSIPELREHAKSRLEAVFNDIYERYTLQAQIDDGDEVDIMTGVCVLDTGALRDAPTTAFGSIYGYLSSDDEESDMDLRVDYEGDSDACSILDEFGHNDEEDLDEFYLLRSSIPRPRQPRFIDLENMGSDTESDTQDTARDDEEDDVCCTTETLSLVQEILERKKALECNGLDTLPRRKFSDSSY